MKASIAAALVSLFAASEVAAHSTFQQLWVNGVDQGSSCIRMPPNNSPIEVGSSNLRCNVGGANGVAGVCGVTAGGTVTVEMHSHSSRSCSEEALSGAHYGPIMVYMSKVADAKTADGSGAFFKIYEDSWSKVPGTSRGDDDNWGVKDLNRCCGKLDVKIPSNIPSGDYLLRAEALALHAAGPSGGAQFYMSCYQITVAGGSGSVPAGVTFPGAYSLSQPGIGGSIHGTLSSYTAPGPAVIAGGTVKVAGSSGCAASGASNPVTNPTTTSPARTTTPAGQATTTLRTTTRSTTAAAQPTTTPASTGGCTSAQWQQCGGNSFSGCTACAGAFKCVKLNDYYSQCQ